MDQTLQDLILGFGITSIVSSGYISIRMFRDIHRGKDTLFSRTAVAIYNFVVDKEYRIDSESKYQDTLKTQEKEFYENSLEQKLRK